MQTNTTPLASKDEGIQFTSTPSQSETAPSMAQSTAPESAQRVTSESNRNFVAPIDANAAIEIVEFGVNGHRGTDIAAEKGTKVVAMKAGTVIKSEFHNSLGNMIEIDHGGKTSLVYAHMDTRVAEVGQSVTQGQQIGTVGSTGATSGNHLHLEMVVDGTLVDSLASLEKDNTAITSKP